MSLLDALKNRLGREVGKVAAQGLQSAAGKVTGAVGKALSPSKTVVLPCIPRNLEELKAMPQAGLKDEFEVAALCVAVLTNFLENEAATVEMLNFLQGPTPLSTTDREFIKERLRGKIYKVFSYFEGTSPENGYTPSEPYTIQVSSNPYSYPEEHRATLYLTSSGADSPRPVSLRRKPSTGQWFITQITFLSDVRVPAEQDPWK